MAAPRIDAHAHFVPQCWRDACLRADLGRPLPPWKEEEHIEYMKKAGITKSILSITDPGTHLVFGNDEDARKLSRECNEVAADLKRRRPDQFGFWAALPLPDVEGSLAEIAYALDTLNADGVGVLTNHHGVYLGDPSLEPIWAELDRRGATVFVHPTLPCEGHSHGAAQQKEKTRFDVPSAKSLTAMMEFWFDEARTTVSMLFSGVVARHTQINFILTHAGGVLPPLVERIIQLPKFLGLGGPEMSSESIRHILRRRIYWDLSGWVFPDQIHGILRLTDTSQLLYGTDYPYTPAKISLDLASSVDSDLQNVTGSAEVVTQILSGNAERLLQKGT